jgi:carboxyl-terminal processing protease
MKPINTTTIYWLVVSFILGACAPQPVALPIITPTPALDTAPAATATVNAIPTSTEVATASTELPISPAASAYLEEALDIIQNNSLYRHSIDWNALTATAFEMAQHAQTPADTYGAIRYVLSVLGDHHSSLWAPNQVAQVQQVTVNESPAPRGKLLLGKLAYIAIEGFGSANMEEGGKYATLEQQLIRDLDTQAPCGWIVDLRENTVGNIWPMLAGIGPILGEGKAGAFVDPDGSTLDWSYQDGQAKQGDLVVVQVNGNPYRLKADFSPVAVLTGVNTKNSGEFIVVSFRGRPHTRSFGLYTAGLSTDNFDFRLSDGAAIVLTVAVYADRTGQTYGDRIYPDELVDDVRKFTYIMDEAIPQPAIDWLMSQPACMAQ